MRLSTFFVPLSIVIPCRGLRLWNWIKSLGGKSNRVGISRYVRAFPGMPDDNPTVVTPNSHMSILAELISAHPDMPIERQRDPPPLRVFDFLMNKHPDEAELVISHSTRARLGWQYSQLEEMERQLNEERLGDWEQEILDWEETMTVFNLLIEDLNDLDTGDNVKGWVPGIFGSSIYDDSFSVEYLPSGDKFVIPLISYPFPFAVTSGNVIVWAWRYGSDARMLKSPHDPNYVIKYTNTCASMISGHIERFQHVDDPLRDEYLILKAIEHLGIAPKAVSLSLAFVPSESDWLLPDFRIMSDFFHHYPDDRKKCPLYASHVRAIVETKLGVNVSDFIRRLYPLNGRKLDGIIMATALNTGLSIIKLLEKLHSAGFIHADVHVGNIVLRDPFFSMNNLKLHKQNYIAPELALIDFGLSVFYPSEIGSNHRKSNPGSLNPRLLSPWHLGKSRIGRRDDIYRALEVTAQLLLPNNAFSKLMHEARELDRRNSDWTNIKSTKSSKDFFLGQLYKGAGINNGKSGLNICQLYHEIPERMCLYAMYELSEALNLIRAIPYVDARPPYQTIITHFHNALCHIGRAHDCP